VAITDYAIAASLLHAEIKAQGVDAVTTVPDLIQFALHDRLKGDPEIRYIECAAENQALTVATGLYIGGKKPMVMMQNQGLFNCINTLRSVGIDARIPMVLSVGAFGREFSNLGKPTTESGRVCLNKVEPVMAALGVPYFHLETADDIGKVAEAFETSRKNECAVVLNIGFFPSWS